MAFPPQFLDELRNRLSIAEVIQRRVRLQKRGREFMGLCPFHNEKTPSFTVSEEKGFFHCFGCGAHGDVVGFVMRAEGLSFPEAVERLAEQAGLQVPKASPEDRQRAERQATLLGVLEAAAAWFEKQLMAPSGRRGRDYLASRGLEDRTIARFRLGWASDSRNGLRSALLKEGFPEALIVEAGLVIRPDSGDAYDRFRGRVMFPITDRRGRVIAFGGRILDEGQPKYLNSPETPLFHKGRVLYGLAQALKSARDAAEVVVAEGYMDVIAMAQAGITQAVAPLGTALTEEQMLELWRLAPEPILCFDGDAAGQRAAARAAERALPLLKPGHSFRFALLPAGEDPDSLIRSGSTGGGVAALRAVLDAALPLADMIWQAEALGRRLDTPERRSGLRQAIKERVARIADRTVAEDYRLEMERRLAEAFGGSGNRPSRQPFYKTGPVRRGLPPGNAVIGGEAARRGVQRVGRMQQEVLLAIFVNHPALLYDHAEELAGAPITAGDLDRLRRSLVDLAAHHPDLDSAGVKDHLSQQGFSGILDALLGGTRSVSFVDPEAAPGQAAEGLTHVLGLMREREAKRETEAAAQLLAEELTEEALARFEARQRVVQHGESRRRDLDRDGPLAARTKR
jgi:DNA primase